MKLQIPITQPETTTPIRQITNITEIIITESLTSLNHNILSLQLIPPNRIACGCSDGSISIHSFNTNELSWKTILNYKKAHSGRVTSLCTLQGNRLLSSDEGNFIESILNLNYDYSIKVWLITENKLGLIKTLNEHTGSIYQVILLNKERFASCSFDKKVLIWEDSNTYPLKATLPHNDSVTCILQLKHKDILISCEGWNSSCLCVWNSNDYKLICKVNGYWVKNNTHMIELDNGNIALSNNKAPYHIVIVDGCSFQVVSVFQLEKDIINSSTLKVFNETSFLYVHEGKILQISNDEMKVLFKCEGKRFYGYNGVVLFENGNFFVIEYNQKISVFKCDGN